jgi:hypothetical protein
VQPVLATSSQSINHNKLQNNFSKYRWEWNQTQRIPPGLTNRIQTPEVSNCLPLSDDELVRICFNDPLRSAESNRKLLLERESELDPEPFSNLREECET